MAPYRLMMLRPRSLIIRAIRRRWRKFPIWARVGVVVFPEDTAQPDALWGLAEEKMHQQKRSRTAGETDNRQVGE